MRVDVFSAKGGVGKTTVAFRLAKALASTRQRPALIVDADLAGTCLGDLLERTVVWKKQPNLTQLVCGRPEDLPEAKLPVYQFRPSSPAEKPRELDKNVKGPAILFCPSHAESEVGTGKRRQPVNHAVLQALVGQESAGGWVGHVITHVIEMTAAVLSDAGGLAGVVVDHGPGTGALQWAEMRAINEELDDAKKKSRASPRQAVFITSRDLVDLAAAGAVNERLTRDELHALQIGGVWVLNRVPDKLDKLDWKSELDRTLNASGIGPSSEDRWYKRAVPLKEDAVLAASYRRSELGAIGPDADKEILCVLDAWERSS